MSYIGVFQMFKIGIGPSSSHTVGPMKAAKQFLLKAQNKGLLDPNKVKTMKTDLYGSLALTGKGHATDRAVILGMLGEDPETVDTTTLYKKIDQLQESKRLRLLNQFDCDFNINFLRSQRLSYHTNGLKFSLLGKNEEEIYKDIWYSIGGGFIINDAETKGEPKEEEIKKVPYEYKNARELISLCEEKNITIPQLVLENEKVFMSELEIKRKIDRIWEVMQLGINNGISTKGTLPGPLLVKRRASALYDKLNSHVEQDPMDYLNWINVYALAVSEENANGGQVVTSPTNGSAGVIPAVLQYYHKYYSKKHPNKIYDFFLTASAIGSLFKMNATISGAEGGCQAEIGVSSSMAAAGLTSALGGNTRQIENSAEMAMEHFIGMTCDPIGGVVQIPCIERNAVGAVKAVNATALALSENHSNKVSLDRIIRVMKKTGEDMKTKYKETSKGGLAKEFKKDVKESNKPEHIREEEVKLDLVETLC
jgi:L-serine dehydratase